MILLLLMCLVVIKIDLSLTGVVEDPRCKVNCSCCIDQICGRHSYFHFNNSCIKGCIDGFRGARCYIKCSDHCKACVSSNSCTKCYDGLYNGKYQNCSEKCDLNCKACARSPGSCTKCHDGFYLANYRNCSEECPRGCKACKSRFNCSECSEGYYSGKEFDFGRSPTVYNCTYQCRETCTKCSSYNNCTGCFRGGYGTTCEKECSVGCLNNTCQQSTGNCLCKANFQGAQCMRCVAGKFGKFCDESCPPNCKGDKSNKMGGVCLNGSEENFAEDSQRDNVTDARLLAGFSTSTVLLVACIIVLVIMLLKRPGTFQRYRKQQNQAAAHAENKVEMAEISASDTANITGCDWTASTDKPYEELHVDETGAEQTHKYLGIEVQNEDSTGNTMLYQNVSKNNEIRIKLC